MTSLANEPRGVVGGRALRLKFQATVVFLAACFCLLAAHVVAGELTVTLPIRCHIEKDQRTWLPEYPVTNGAVSYVEWVLKGDSINCWKELYDQRTVTTQQSIREHLDTWKKMLARIDAKATVSEEKNPDDSITVTYTSLVGDEMGISRYFKGKSGIYILSYRVRPKLKSEQTLKIWREIISGSSLAPQYAGKKG